MLTQETFNRAIVELDLRVKTKECSDIELIIVGLMINQKAIEKKINDICITVIENRNAQKESLDNIQESLDNIKLTLRELSDLAGFGGDII